MAASGASSRDLKITYVIKEDGKEEVVHTKTTVVCSGDQVSFGERLIMDRLELLIAIGLSSEDLERVRGKK